MKVLLLCPMADGQTGPAWKHAFEKLGHKVVAVDARLAPQNSYNMSLQFKPDLIFCSRTPALTEQVARIKQMFKNAVVYTWNCDARANINHWAKLFDLVRLSDYYFTVDMRTIPQWKQINPNTFWLPQGLQDEVYGKPKEITNRDRETYACDVSFAGGILHHTHKHRVQTLDAVRKMGVNFKFWGCEGRPRVYDEEHNKMVYLSKINLGCSAFPGAEGKYVSVRDYKILGAGGFLLESYRKGIYELFPSNILDCYSTSQELVEKVRYWLDHEEERKEIAERGYRWVHKNTTYTDRIRKALGHMEIQS